MGGKTTVLRTIANLVVLAQIGCDVPAQKLAMTPMDAIFTRLGSSDNM